MSTEDLVSTEERAWQTTAGPDGDLLCNELTGRCIGWDRIIVSNEDRILAEQDGEELSVAAAIEAHRKRWHG